MKYRMGKIALLAFLGLAIGAGAAWMQTGAGERQASRIEPAAGIALAGAEIGGAFSLTNHDGKAVTEKDYAGTYKIVYFGFTSCPEICPAGLQKIAAVMKDLGDKGDLVQPLFITVDPARDTPDVMKQYVAMFHPRLIGLTGTAEQIRAAQDAYKVYAAKVEDPALSDYTMNHSSFTFFMSPEGKPIDLFAADESAQDMAAAIMKAL